ncbi:MAG TPA: tetratricopeptide repeat protein, partial [Archangium sp.]
AATPEAPAPTEQVQALAKAVEKRDIPLALALYQLLDGVPPTALSPALHLFVGQASATQGDYALAVQALEAAADVAPEDPLAPRALVLLARVLDEHLQEPARAQGVYQYIVDRYPDTDASRFAQGRLPPTS